MLMDSLSALPNGSLEMSSAKMPAAGNDGREIAVSTHALRDHGSDSRILRSVSTNLAPIRSNGWLPIVDTAMRPLRRGRP